MAEEKFKEANARNEKLKKEKELRNGNKFRESFSFAFGKSKEELNEPNIAPQQPRNSNASQFMFPEPQQRKIKRRKVISD
jgi:hypothetical protein